MALDAGLIGLSFPTFDLAVDQARSSQIAVALGVADTAFGSRAVAEAQGLAGVPVVPVYFTNAVQLELTGRNPVAELVSSRALLGGQDYFLDNGPVYVGEHLTGTSTVTDVSVRLGGSGQLTILTIETVYSRDNGESALRAITRSIDFE